MSTVITEIYWNLSAQLKPAFKKFIKFVKILYGNYSKSSFFQSFTALFMVASLLCFLIVMASTYFYLSPSVERIVKPNRNRGSFSGKSAELGKGCNPFDGRWVIDETYPLYNASQCPFSERGFDCLANGRKDKEYLKWRWKPKGCEIPRFDVHALLKFLRGKRVVFVGDSLSRTQWESMICMLMSGVEDKNSVYEASGSEITKQSKHLVVWFRSHSFTIEFYRSIFLVEPGPAPKRSPKRVKTVVKLDQMDEISREWIDSDILIFNSGHWWTRTKLFDLGWYFQVGGKVKIGMSINNGFKIALATWRSWLENSVNPHRTRVFFRTFESSHWSSGSRQNCKVTKLPLSKLKGKQKNSKSEAIIRAVEKASIPVQLLHVTPMSAYRSDAHVGTWSDNPSVPDCSHWCLPGVPDMWNELLFSFLLSK
ncbi:protein trichome berefringence-like 7 [Andrographis paniculata]|uniref:protein trichome berefringence-like 7 n=1 Tax=Andrographis paniculata TaxID=175694 RepID=UPI0021E7605A|nr:protein trichome berefringence-like 7 [Andrographis paniculata]